MEPEAKYTIVGAVVLALLAMLVGVVVWLKSSGTGVEARTYRIDFVQQTLEGLAPRSDVTMRGLRVGSVTGFRFSQRKPGAVEVFVALHPSTPVLDTTRAIVQHNLFSGLATIQLVNSSERGAPLRPARPGSAVPVIPEGESSEQQVTANVAQVAQRLNATLSAENQQAFAQTLANLRRVSEHADRSLGKVDTALDSLTDATRRVGALAGTMDKSTRTLASRYDALGAQATGTVRDASDAVRKASADVDRLARRADALMSSGDRELRTSAESLRSAAQSVGVAADRLHEPSEIIYGPAADKLGPGEGKR